VPELFSRQRFAGFGLNRFDPAKTELPLTVVQGARPSALRAQVRLACPRRPGVYGMIDRRGELVYVGKAKSLRARLLSYFRVKSRDHRATEIIRETRAIAWEYAASEFAALLRELELILRWQPRFNVKDQPRRQRRWLICVGREPAAHVFISPRPTRTALHVFGPVPVARMASEAVRRLNDWYGLKDCPSPQVMHFREQQELFPLVRVPGCLRHEIGTCLAPCAAACTQDEYTAQVQGVVNFLRGQDLTPLRELERAMQEAASVQQFERAASLRDQAAALTWLHQRLEYLRQARRLSFIYPIQGVDGQEIWYAIHQGMVRAVLRSPQSEAERAKVRPILLAISENRPVEAEEQVPEPVEGLLLVSSWFRNRPEELKRTRAWPEVLASQER
jgi:excinuclease ABC subunit C